MIIIYGSYPRRGSRSFRHRLTRITFGNRIRLRTTGARIGRAPVESVFRYRSQSGFIVSACWNGNIDARVYSRRGILRHQDRLHPRGERGSGSPPDTRSNRDERGGNWCPRRVHGREVRHGRQNELHRWSGSEGVDLASERVTRHGGNSEVSPLPRRSNQSHSTISTRSNWRKRRPRCEGNSTVQ